MLNPELKFNFGSGFFLICSVGLFVYRFTGIAI